MLDSFIEMLAAERGAAKNTQIAYLADIEDLKTFLAPADINHASSDDLRRYIRHLSSEGMQAASLARRRSAVRQYFRFLKSERVRADNPALLLVAPKAGRKLPDCLSLVEIETLLQTLEEEYQLCQQNKASAHACFSALRLWCMLEILYASGLRVSELLSLPFHLRPAQDGLLNVIGKGNKERLVALSPAAITRLIDYQQQLKALNPKVTPKWLFPSTFKEASAPLTRQRLGQMFKALALRAGLDHQRVSPHKIRHAFASHLLESGADLRSLQQLLGHADISTTEIYTHIAEAQKRQLIQKHPLAYKK